MITVFLQDVVAYKSLPLPGYEISAVGHTSHSTPLSHTSPSTAGTSDTETMILKVSHPKQMGDAHYFLADSVTVMQCVISKYLVSFSFIQWQFILSNFICDLIAFSVACTTYTMVWWKWSSG